MSELIICPRCNLPIKEHEIGGFINNEPAHFECVLEEMDEQGFDDFFCA